MGNFAAVNLRYNPFTQAFTAYGYGYGGNPKETHVIPNTSPYWIYLNEIPQNDTPSTLFINEQGGSDWTEVSASTSPAAGQFRVAYGSDGTTTATNAGQGIVEFNSADAGKTMEVKYYGLGNILQNQFLNDLLDGDYGTPSFGAGLESDTISAITASTGVGIESQDGSTVRFKLLNIGDWNMNVSVAGSASVNVAHGLSQDKIRSVSVFIIPDSGSGVLSYKPLEIWDTGVSLASGYIDVTSSNIALSVVATTVFDSANYDATSFNRGYVIVTYKV